MSSNKYQDRSSYIKKIAGKISYLEAPSSGIIKARDAIDLALMDEDSPLSTTLKHFSEQEKTIFIRALITNNQSVIGDTLSYCFTNDIDKSFSLDDLKKITAHIDMDTKWLNDTVVKMINAALENTPSIDVVRILRNVMGKIPDNIINVQSKYQITRYFSSVKYLAVEYIEPVQSHQQNKFSGKITLKEFQTALKAQQTGLSEYIFLCVGVLQSIADKHSDISEDLKAIRQSYANIDYESAIAGIKKLCNKHKSKIGKEIFNELTEGDEILEENTIDKNYSRRFFENRIASLYQAQPLTYLESVNNIAKHFLKNLSSATTSEAARVAISALSEDYTHTAITDQAERLKDLSKNYRKKGRTSKEGFNSKEYEPTSDPTEFIMSRNPGVMKSSQPNYADEITENILTNKNVDIHDYSKKNLDYPLMRQRSAYVTSISGHTFYIAACLEQYIKDQLNNSNLSKINEEINSFINAYIMTYISQGYHSLLEILDVFNESSVQAIFNRHGIDLDLKWPDKLLEAAFKDTQEYTKGIYLKETLQQELLNPRRKSRKKMTNPAVIQGTSEKSNQEAATSTLAIFRTIPSLTTEVATNDNIFTEEKTKPVNSPTNDKEFVKNEKTIELPIKEINYDAMVVQIEEQIKNYIEKNRDNPFCGDNEVSKLNTIIINDINIENIKNGSLLKQIENILNQGSNLLDDIRNVIEETEKLAGIKKSYLG